MAGDALDLIQQEHGTFSLIVTDPPYAFGGSGDEHELSAVVAVTLREAAARLERGRWMVIMCAASWRSQCYMAEAVRGIVQPVRTATWCKPKARTKVVGAGWRWASVSVMAFRKGKAIDQSGIDSLDHITAEPVVNGRRAELPPGVARWMVAPFAVAGGRFLDPFAGSGAIVRAAAECGMDARGYEKNAGGGLSTKARISDGGLPVVDFDRAALRRMDLPQIERELALAPACAEGEGEGGA